MLFSQENLLVAIAIFSPDQAWRFGNRTWTDVVPLATDCALYLWLIAYNTTVHDGSFADTVVDLYSQRVPESHRHDTPDQPAMVNLTNFTAVRSRPGIRHTNLDISTERTTNCQSHLIRRFGLTSSATKTFSVTQNALASVLGSVNTQFREHMTRTMENFFKTLGTRLLTLLAAQDCIQRRYCNPFSNPIT